MLFIWARAEVLSKRYGYPILAPEWFKPLRIGPLLRGEKFQRYYLTDFTNEGYVTGLRKWLALVRFNERDEALLNELSETRTEILTLSEMKGFGPILAHHRYIEERLRSIVSAPIRAKVTAVGPPFIGVHIRRGDFTLIGQDIPISWYVNVCKQLRELVGSEMPIQVFTDGTVAEVREILALPNVALAPKRPAICDLMLLSRSTVLVGTSLSTFSLWASYLRRVPTIWSPVSPGVYGYGLATDNHYYSDWEGNLDRPISVLEQR